MESEQTLTFNETALQQLPEEHRPLFIFEWLRYLDKVLINANKTEIKECQQKLVSQLMGLLKEQLGPPSRAVLSRCLATLFSVGDTFLLFETVNKCNDLVKVKDDSPSYLPTKLGAICCLGGMYEKLGRMMGRLYEETVQTLLRSLKSAESQTRLEIIITLQKICVGLGTAAPLAVREVARVSKQLLVSDRSSPVKVAAAETLLAVLPLAKLSSAEIETQASACIRALDGSCYQVRCAVSELLGSLIAATQETETANPGNKAKTAQQTKKESKKNSMSLEEGLNILMGGFLRGGSSFLKGDIIKSGSGVNREMRVGVTNAYVIFVQKMGGYWLEKNLTTFVNHVLDLVANPKAANSHVDAVYSRKCISYILRNTIGRMLGEKAQCTACKELVMITAKQMNSIDFSPENAKDSNQETLFSQHLLVCALIEIGELSLTLGTSLQNLTGDLSLKMIESIYTVLVHPCIAARLSAAWCLKCVCIVLPNLTSPIVDKCIDKLDSPTTNSDALSGYSAALAAVIGSVQSTTLGIPHSRGKLAFNTAEQMLRSAAQAGKSAGVKTNAGWLIIGSICTLGEPVVKGLLPRMLLLWRNCFPRTAKELESEKNRGDAFTWQMTLENRAGALSAMLSLLEYCPSLAHEHDAETKISQIIDSSLAVLANINSVVRTNGEGVLSAAALLRARALRVAARALPPPSPALLRLLAADLTADTVASGLLRTVGHPSDTILLGPAGWIYETDHADIENQLLHPVSASGSGALEHEPCCLYARIETGGGPGAVSCPGPLPLGVAVLDAAIMLFGQVFPRAANKHRLQMLEHFTECIKMAKGVRQETLQINIYTALQLGLKGLTELKTSLVQEDVKNILSNLIMTGLSSQSVWVRSAAAQCAGRVPPDFADRLVTYTRTANTAEARAGAIVGLGCIIRSSGGGARPASLAALTAACVPLNAPSAWPLHALASAATGPMFRQHVDKVFSLALGALFSSQASNHELHRSVGRLLAALITVLGPELQGNSALSIRSLSGAAAVKACGATGEALGALQRVHLFYPAAVNLADLVPVLCTEMFNDHLWIRRAALACVRQVSQRHATALCQYAQPQNLVFKGITISSSGFPASLFALLDVESDATVLSYARDALVCLLQASVTNTDQRNSTGPDNASNLKDWITLCKKVISVRQDDNSELDQDIDADDDQEEFHADNEQNTHPAIPPRWQTRTFAMDCIQKIMLSCEVTGDAAHFDLVLARERREQNRPESSYLVYHLGEMVRAAFVCATGEAVSVRLAGLDALKHIVRLFARAPEPGFPGHLLLEHYQAQVGAALRPAFAADTPPHVTAAACDVCSTWIGSGVARDINDLRRVHQLLVSSLHKLNTKSDMVEKFNESMSTLEKLSILKAWAEIYIVAMTCNGSAPGSYVKELESKPISGEHELSKWRQKAGVIDNLMSIDSTQTFDNCQSVDNSDEYGDFESKGESLLHLVEPELGSLSENWLAALRDHALLSLPQEVTTASSSGTFFSRTCARAARPHYAAAWPALALAAALRINEKADDNRENESESAAEGENEEVGFKDQADEKFFLIFGVCMEALCFQRDTSPEDVITVLLSLNALLERLENRARLLKDRALAIELCNALHRIALTQENVEPLLLAIDILHTVVTGAKEDLKRKIDGKIKELAPDELSDGRPIPDSVLEVVHTLGEGGPTGDLPPGKSLVFTCLEVALCLLVRRLPTLSPQKQDRKVGIIGEKKGLGVHGDILLIKCLACMSELTSLTSAQGALTILPTLLFLATGVLKESGDNRAMWTAAVTLLEICAETAKNSILKEQSQEVLNSALAKVISLVNHEEVSWRVREVAGGRAMSALLACAPPALLYPAINHLRRCAESEDSETFIECCNILRSLWRRADSVGALAARWVGARVAARAVAAPVLPSGAAQARAAVVALHDLLAATPVDSRTQMLKMLVPIVTSYLREPTELVKATADVRSLHEFGLNWLTKIGPLYPKEFKSIMQQSPELRSKLESAVKASHAAAARNAALKNNVTNSAQNIPAKPQIQLKTDFSDFR